MSAQTVDPFDAPAKVPAVTFKDAPIGTTYKLHVRGPAEKVQGRDFETDELAVWKNNDGTTAPKYSAVVRVRVVDGAGRMPNDDERAVWAVIPSALFVAMQKALEEAKAKFADGGELIINYYADKPNEKNPRLNAAKQYRCKYTPNVYKSEPAPGADPFASAAPADTGDAPPW